MGGFSMAKPDFQQSQDLLSNLDAQSLSSPKSSF